MTEETEKPAIAPLFASLDDMRERLRNCSSCAQRRELLSRWFASGRPDILTMNATMQTQHASNPPRDMSNLFKKER